MHMVSVDAFQEWIADLENEASIREPVYTSLRQGAAVLATIFEINRCVAAQLTNGGRTMKWVLVFPTYRMIHEVTQYGTAFLVLMNLSIVLPIAFALIFRKGIGVANKSQTIFKSIAASLVALVVGAVVIYYVLFTDFGFISTELIPNVLNFLSRSPIMFAVFYCLCFPALIGILLLVVFRSLQRITRGNQKSMMA